MVKKDLGVVHYADRTEARIQDKVKLAFLLACWLLFPVLIQAVELNGYYFGSDSAEIWGNKYFSQYDPAGEPPLYLFGSRLFDGYGAFGFWFAQFYDETDTYIFEDDEGIERTINCVVRREHGYWPKYIDHVEGGSYTLSRPHNVSEDSVTVEQGISSDAKKEHGFVSLDGALYEYSNTGMNSFNDLLVDLCMEYDTGTAVKHVVPAYFKGEKYTRYDYLAKDINDNIHILRSIRPQESQNDLDDTALIEEGGTTLMYPDNPEVNMPVYSTGVVLDTDADIITDGRSIAYTDCLVINKTIETNIDSDDELGIFMYLAEGEGEVWLQYDWGNSDGNKNTLIASHQISGFEKVNDFNHPGTDTSVFLNGYIFDDDSTYIWENTFFSDFTTETIGTYSKVLFGYNEFEGYNNREYYQGNGRYQNIDCIVFCKHSYGANLELVKSFEYLAKDIDDNIHLLQRITPGATSSYEFDDDILNEGGSTLLYPSSPVDDQIVYGGYVDDTSATVVYSSSGVTISDTYTDCVSIRMGSGTDDHTIYYNSGSGIVAITYENGTNGFTVEENVVTTGTSSSSSSSGSTATTTGLSTSAGSSDDDDLEWYQCFIMSAAMNSIGAGFFVFPALISGIIVSLARIRRFTKDS